MHVFHLLRIFTLFWSLSEAAEWHHILHWHRQHVATGIHWLPWPLSGAACEHHVHPCHGHERWPCLMQWVWGRRVASSSNLLLAYRSDSCGHTISRLDRLISSKGDYFPSSAFPLISLSFSTAAPRCSDFILPKSYQQACCNMDKANTCYSLGSSCCDCCIAGISPSFQLDALRLSAACCYVIS